MPIARTLGELMIDTRGTITFTVTGGQTILRITHLRAPVPVGTHIIDMAAVDSLLSYTPLPTDEPRPEEPPRMLGADDV